MHHDVPTDLSDSVVDRQANNYQAGASFQYDTWYWGANYSYGLEKDFGAFATQSRHRLSDIIFQWQIGQRISLGTQAQYNTILDRSSSNVMRSWLAGLDARFSMFDDRVATAFNYNVNQDGARDDSIDSETRTYGLRVDWLLRQPLNNRPGWTLWLQGERQEIGDRLSPASNQKPYQVFVGARMEWPVRVPQR